MSDYYFHLPADPTPREIARLRILAREFSSCQINLIGPERIGEETLESFASTLGFTNLATVLNAKNETTAEQNFGDVIVSVSEPVRIELELAGDPEIWVRDRPNAAESLLGDADHREIVTVECE